MLLLHAFPQAHAIWHRISPALAASGRTVVATDLRGSGDSSRPVAWEDHSGYSFRSMAADQVETGAGLYPEPGNSSSRTPRRLLDAIGRFLTEG